MLSEKPAANEDIYLEKLEDGAILHNKDKVHIVNNTAFLVWLHCNGKTTVQQIIEIIENSYPDVTLNRDDILKVIENFSANGLVV